MYIFFENFMAAKTLIQFTISLKDRKFIQNTSRL